MEILELESARSYWMLILEEIAVVVGIDVEAVEDEDEQDREVGSLVWNLSKSSV